MRADLDPKDITLESVTKFVRADRSNNDTEFAEFWDSREALLYRSRLLIHGLNKDDTLHAMTRLAFMAGKLAGMVEMRNV